jgi:hypothetical protein
MLLATTFISGLFFGFGFNNLKVIIKKRKRRKATNDFIETQLSKDYFSAFTINKFDSIDLNKTNREWWKLDD